MSRQEIIKSKENRIDELLCRGVFEERKVYLFGYNPYTECICNFLLERGISIQAVLDNSDSRQGKKIGSYEVVYPGILQNAREKDLCVLIASQHAAAMIEQLNELIGDDLFSVFSLFDFVRYNEEYEMSKKYWMDDIYERQRERLNQGERIYEALKNENELLVISPTISIGDNFLWELSFKEYKDERGLSLYQIVVASQGAYKAIQMFNEKSLKKINKDEMEALTKYVIFMGEEELECLILYPRFSICRCLDLMASWKKMAWEQIYPQYFFQLDGPYKLSFPEIHCPEDNSAFMIRLGMKKNRTVILSPYANTVGELPLIFWVKLAEDLVREGFSVFTNTVGEQKPIKGTAKLDIPLNESGTYLEYAGYFVALRNGLCDIVGQAKCSQIIIFRERVQLHLSEMEFNDLHVDGVSANAMYVTYDEDDYGKSVCDVKALINSRERV